MTPARRSPAAFALLPALLIGAPAAAVFLDGPPPAHTGGFGEPTCATSCHFDVTEPDPAGGVALEGLPEAYSPGARYLLALRVEREGMRKAGYELSARLAGGEAAGAQAGVLRAADPASAVMEDGGIRYAHQTRAGTEPDSAGSRTWMLEWVAPDGAAGPVVFHFVGNAADGDESQLGDHVYADSVSVAPAPAGGLSGPRAGALPRRSSAAAGSRAAGAGRWRTP